MQGCLDNIEVRTHNEYVKQAALQGITLDFKHVKKKFQELTKEQIEMMAEVSRAAAQRVVLEKAEKARKRNGNK